MRYYTYLGHGDSWGGYVTRETVQATAKPSEYRVDLGDWVAGWIVGRDVAVIAATAATFPSQAHRQQQDGGAA